MKASMKHSVTLLTASILLLLPHLSAKPTYKLQQQNKEVKALKSAPRVSAYDCTECVWNDGVNYVCLDHSIDVKVGWEFE